MGPAAVLKVLVQVDGMAKAAAQLQTLDKAWEKTGRSASGAGDEFDGAGQDVQSMADDVKRARDQVASLGDDVKKMATEVNDARGKVTDLDRETKTLDADVKKAAQSIGAMGSSSSSAGSDVQRLGGEVDKTSRKVDGMADDMAKARKATDLWRDAQGRWRNSTGQFANDAEKAAAGIDDLDRRSRRGAGGLGVISSAVLALGGGFGRLGGSLVGVLPLLMALSGALFAIGAALGPLIGLAAAAGVGLTVAAQAAGVFALASMGVIDALKEQSSVQAAASKAGLTAANQERAAARAIQSAHEGVRGAKLQVRSASDALAQAQRAEKYATEDLTVAERAQDAALKALGAARQAARRDLEDMRAALVRSALDEQSAIMALVDAREALQRAISGPDASTIAEAQDAAADAARGETQAVLNLTKARERLTAVSADPTASATDKAQAALDLADAENAIGDAQRSTLKAAQALAALQKGADPAAIAKARLDVAAAEQNVADATRDRARQQKDTLAAEKAGIAGAAQVIAAKQQIAAVERDVLQAQRALNDSHRQVTAAEHAMSEASRNVALAMQAVRDAQIDAHASATGAASAAVDLNQKFNALPPAAQALVRVLLALKPRLDDLRATAAAGLFPGVTAGIQAAMGSFGAIKRVTAETATVMGGLAQRAGELVGSKGFGKDLETIGGRNALIIDRLGRAAIYLGDAFRHLLVAAGPLTTWLAKATLEWSRNVAESTKAGRESGKLAGFFEKTKDVLKTVGSIIGNVADGLLNMGKAAAPSGRGILQSLDAITERFATWTKSVGGQRALQNFFEESRALAGQLMPALGGVLQSLGSLAFSVLPAYVAVLRLLGPLAGPLIQAWILWKVALTAVAIATSAATAAQWLFNAAMTANPITLVVIGLAALAAALVVAYHKSETFRDIVNSVWHAIKSIAAPVLAWLATATVNTWNAISGATSAVWGVIGGTVTGALRGIQSVMTTVFGIYVTVARATWEIVKTVTTVAWGVITTVLTTAFGVIRGLVTTYFGIYKTIITTTWDLVKIATQTAWSVITTIATGAWSGLRAAASTAWDGIRAVIVTPVRAARDLISGIWHEIGVRASSAWGALTKGVGGFAGDMKDAITEAFKGAANAVIGFVNKIFSVLRKIPGVEKAIPGDIKKLAEGGEFKAARGLARGGAFARTGGVVSSPITLMGEEAPRHPEFVIPSNPAYRDRARGLLAQAAKAIGLAKGGTFVSTAYGPPWNAMNGTGVTATGVDLRPARKALGVAVDPKVIPLGSQLKIQPNPFGTSQLFSAFDTGGAIKNNRLDFYDWRGRAEQMAWGMRQVQVMLAGKGKSLVGESVKGGGSLLGSVGGALGGLLDKGAAFFLDQLPGVGDLPDWMHGMGKVVLDGVSGWIKDKAGNLLSSLTGGNAGGDLPKGVNGKIKDAIALAMRLGHARPSANQLTGGQHAPGSWHYQGRAADFGAAGHSVGQMKQLFNALLTKFGSNLKELFYDPMGFYVKNGKRIGGAIGGHTDHLHAALAKGGTYGGLPYIGKYHGGGVAPREGLAHVQKGEEMTPPGQRAQGPLVHVEHLHVRDELDIHGIAADLAWRVATG